MKNSANNKQNEENKHTTTKLIICIIIIIIIILLLITSCTSSFWGKIGSIFDNSHHIIDPDNGDKKELINKSLLFDVTEQTITLDDSSYKITYHTVDILAENVVCTTSDANIATCVAYDGYVVINPKKVGDVTIYATTEANGIIYKAMTELTITEGKNGIKLASRSGSIDLSKTNTKNVSYNLVGIKGNVEVKVDDESIATATASNGVLKIKALKPGETKITLSIVYGGRTYSVDYKLNVVEKGTSVTPKPTTTKKTTTKKDTVALKLNVTSKELKVKEKFQIEVLSGTVKKWKSSKSSIASVSKNGLVTAKKPGTVTITATDKNNNKVTVTIYVTESVQSPELVLSTTNRTLKVGETFTPAVLKGTVKTWSTSDKTIATVDKNGKITAKKPGVVTITAKDKKGHKTTLIITVIDATSTVNPTTPENPTNPTSPVNPTNPADPTKPTTPVEPTQPVDPTKPTEPTKPTTPVSKDSIVLEDADTTKELEVNQTLTLKVKQGTADSWESSNSNIVSVVGNGKEATITAVAPGTVTITATDAAGNKSVITITVKGNTQSNPTYNALELSTTELNMSVDDVRQIVATQGKVISWELLDNKNDAIVLTVNGNTAEVKANKPGTAKIKVTGANPNEVIIVNVTVKAQGTTPKPDAKIEIDATKVPEYLRVDESFDLSVAIKAGTPATWSSSPSDVLSVDKNGKLTAKKPGTATITVTDAAGNESSVQIEVRAKLIELSSKEISLVVGDKATVTDINGTGPIADWKIDDKTPNIVEIENGVITALAEGTAKVYAMNASGEETLLLVHVLSVNTNLNYLKVEVSGEDKPQLETDNVSTSNTIRIDSDINKDKVSITAKAADATHTKVEFIYNGISYNKFEDIKLEKGKTLDIDQKRVSQYIVTIKVTPQKGESKYYTITINKEQSSNKDLTLEYDKYPDNDKTLKVNDNGQINNVSYSETPIALTSKLADSRSLITVTLDGIAADLNSLNLKPGDNELVVTVTAEDKSIRDYKYIIHRAIRTIDLIREDGFKFNLNYSQIFGFNYEIIEEFATDYVTSSTEIKDITFGESDFEKKLAVTALGVIQFTPTIEDIGTHKVKVYYNNETYKEVEITITNETYYLKSPKYKYDVYYNQEKPITTSIALHTDIFKYNGSESLYKKDEKAGKIIVTSTTGDNGKLEITYDATKADISFVKNNDASNSYILQVIPKAGATEFNINVKGSINGSTVNDFNITAIVKNKYILTLNACETEDDENCYLDSLRNKTYTTLLESGDEFSLAGYKPYKLKDEKNCEIYIFANWLYNNAPYTADKVEMGTSNITLIAHYIEDADHIEIGSNIKTGYFDLKDLELFNSMNNAYDNEKKTIYPGLDGGHGITIENSSDKEVTITKLIIQEQNLCLSQGRCLNMGYAIRRNNPDGVNNTYYYGDSPSAGKYAVLNQATLDGVDNYYDAATSITHIEIPVNDPGFIIPANGGTVEIGVLWKWVELDDDLDTRIGQMANINNKYKFWLSVEYESEESYCKLKVNSDNTNNN